MAKGDLISYSNLCSMIGDRQWSCNFVSSFTGGLVLYAMAPTIYCAMSAHITGLWSSLDTGWAVQYYSPSAEGNWATAQSFAISVRQNARDRANYFYHNVSRAGISAEDVPRVHLWRFTGNVTWTQGKNWYAHFGLYCGGIEHMTEDEFNSVCKFDNYGRPKPIIGIKPMIYRVGATSLSDNNTTYMATEQEIIDYCMSNPYRGTAISVDSGTYRYCV